MLSPNRFEPASRLNSIALPPGAAIFLDRDGVINRRRPDHVKSWEEFSFLPGALRSLAALAALGVPLVIVTNQAVVGRGLLDPDGLRTIHRLMLAEMQRAGAHIAAIYACLHAPEDGCACRKPAPGLLLRAAVDLGIVLSNSILVGDARSDVEAAIAVGCTPILLGNGASATARSNADRSAYVLMATDLSEAVACIQQLWQ